MAVAPDNDLPRPFEIRAFALKGYMTDVDRDAALSNLQAEMTTASRQYTCPKCGGEGYHNATVDDPSISPDYPVRCTLGIKQPIYTTDPTVVCDGWGLLTANVKYQIDQTTVVPA